MAEARRGEDERRLAVGALEALALLAPVAAAVAGYAAGWAGAASALIGLVFVLVMFGASGALLAWVARRNPTRRLRGVGVLVGGAIVRLPLYAAALFGLSQPTWVHRPSLALATAAAVAVTLAYELRLIAGRPRLFWLDDAETTGRDIPPTPTVGAAGSQTTRSHTL